MVCLLIPTVKRLAPSRQERAIKGLLPEHHLEISPATVLDPTNARLCGARRPGEQIGLACERGWSEWRAVRLVGVGPSLDMTYAQSVVRP